MITRYETENSFYDVDLANGRYRRSPIFQQAVVSHRLTYGDWHDLADMDEPVKVLEYYGETVLHIMERTSTVGIFTSALKGMSEVEDV